MSIRHNVHSAFKSVYNKYWRDSSSATTSSFQDSGKLTLEEFITAGDNLIELCPAWKWVQGTNSKDKANNRCLVLENIVCAARASAVANTVRAKKVRIPNGEEGDDGEEFEEITFAVEEGNQEKDDHESEDDEDFKPPESGPDSAVRYYDLSICYDPYYRTPQFFFSPSYKFYSSPDRHNTSVKMLEREEMLQDVNIINKNNTVTIDKHPLKFPEGVLNYQRCIGIHNCRHAERMKSELEYMRRKKLLLMSQSNAGGNEVDSGRRLEFPTHLSLILFLKMISTAVPTIQYDVVSCDFELV
ncbi:hypothetical protein AGDE_09568 [Angomonas deanei]|uniref:Autophagocytosis associated protein (Atg3), N-terminal domain/Autophagocytosis associated protein, active-site domain/Autophagocytosis associated protein C-terminal, putative n=1 Tax=Angomonas deanei TaxID=59799 RepID=A0A7G2CUC0_9TRYP|nr:hypothetical protein AGDE_09568 [Angomonas deanei]CAD2222817.1 Autophagocytosis associated protein (Atg3), N-terminal domain/Autophagocytosis associated protein, active-site domain/Autophagocytosis associated protein C-terminal, putative [Angomonas deanei]|eukprot:EPY30190.1 hypothetical protein AGDE_09568 [Angomonas deanei]